MKNLSSIAVLTGLLLAASTPLTAALPLPRSSPEKQGISSKDVLAFVKEVNEKIDTMHSFMIVRHGHVIAEGWWKPEAADREHVLWSLSKSFSSTAIGIAIADGKLKIDDPVLKFFPDEAPAEPSANLKAMTVRHLLTMTCGHETEPRRPQGGSPSIKQFFEHPVPLEPGTHFLYNTMGSYMLSAIVTKVTGETVLEYLMPRLFEPMGIENPKWDVSVEGYSLGGYGLFLRTEDIAKFGQLYLQSGEWNGKQLVPAGWVKMATSKQVPNTKDDHASIGDDWKQGYGFQFWRCQHNAYRGDGKDGQFCVVLPEKDTVIAITANTGNMQGELDAIWSRLLPALEDEVLPENPEALFKLNVEIDKLEIPIR